MEQFIGLDVSLKETAISIRQNGARVWRGKCPSDPVAIAVILRDRAPNAKRVVFETGPLSIWFFHALTAEGVPAICIDARHAKAALDMMATNKTDANDADGLAHLADVGFYREVRVKQYDSMLSKTMIGARGQLLKISIELSNQIRGVLKTFGLIVPKSTGRLFETNVRAILNCYDPLRQIVLPLLEAWRSVRAQTAIIDRQLIRQARANERCQLLMTIPGVGSIIASSFVASIEEPENFTHSRSVGAWLGLTPRRYQSGEVDYVGRISRRGDRHLRALLYQAAVVMMTRGRADSNLRSWGVRLKEKIGFKRAAVAVARKLSVVMHSMLKSGMPFQPVPASAV